MIGEYDATGAEIKTYGYKPGSTWTTNPLFMKVGTEYYFYHNDHLGTPQKITGVNGAVVWSAKYSSFGKAEIDPASTITNNLRFPGQYEDGETGFHYNFYRYYNPSIGRYLNVDPSHSIQPSSKIHTYLMPALIYQPKELNKYNYAMNNTLMYMDQLGLMSGRPSAPVPHPGVPSVPDWIIQNTLVEGIGGLYAGLCVDSLCKRKVVPNSKNDTGAECFSVMSKHNLPPGTAYSSGAFYTVCQRECYRIATSKEFEKNCICKQN